MIFLNAFLIGGAICALGELIKELFKLTNAHITGLFVFIGAFLDINNIYDKLIDISGAGAMLPITSFGHSLADASYTALNSNGIMGMLTGIFDKTAGGIGFVILLSFLLAIIFKPKS